jgi:hypothetical protein
VGGVLLAMLPVVLLVAIRWVTGRSSACHLLGPLPDGVSCQDAGVLESHGGTLPSAVDIQKHDGRQIVAEWHWSPAAPPAMLIEVSGSIVVLPACLGGGRMVVTVEGPDGTRGVIRQLCNGRLDLMSMVIPFRTPTISVESTSADRPGFWATTQLSGQVTAAEFFALKMF